MQYEDEELQAVALSLMPVEEMEADAAETARLSTQLGDDVPTAMQDALVQELLAWFKTFFTWVGLGLKEYSMFSSHFESCTTLVVLLLSRLACNKAGGSIISKPTVQFGCSLETSGCSHLQTAQLCIHCAMFSSAPNLCLSFCFRLSEQNISKMLEWWHWQRTR